MSPEAPVVGAWDSAYHAPVLVDEIVELKVQVVTPGLLPRLDGPTYGLDNGIGFSDEP